MYTVVFSNMPADIPMTLYDFATSGLKYMQDYIQNTYIFFQMFTHMNASNCYSQLSIYSAALNAFFDGTYIRSEEFSFDE